MSILYEQLLRTCPHTVVVRDEVGVTRDGGQEQESVGGPGHRPAEEHHQTGSPQLPLRLEGGDMAEFSYHYYHQSLLEKVGPCHVSHLLGKLLYTASRM